MSDNLGFALAVIFGELLPAAVGFYAAYWAFSIRRELVGRVYRNHALWLGVLCILIEAAKPFQSISSTNVTIALLLNLFTIMLLAFVFAFIDSTVVVARLSDPLFRRILHWDRLRIALWCDLGLTAIFFVYTAVSPSFNASAWAILGFPLVLLPFVLGAPAVLIGARRSKDPVLRGSLKWFGAVLLLFLITVLLSFVELAVIGISAYDSYYSYPALAFAIPAILGAFFLYRSVMSLVPMKRLLAKS